MKDNYDIQRQMAEHLAQAGLVVEQLEADGEIHRCGVTGKERGKDGSYKAFLDAPASLWWKNWRTGEEGTWSAKEESKLTEEEREEWRARVRQIKEERAQELSQRRTHAAEKAGRLWATFLPATADNPYLVRKGIEPLGDIRQTKNGSLVLPILNAEGKLVSLQFIDSEGGKLFLSGGEVKSCFCPLPSVNAGREGPLLIAEGYATAASLRMATGHATLAAFNCGNLLPVAEMARQKYPQREILICADNDLTNTKADGSPCNPGMEEANRAAYAVDGKLVCCPDIDGVNTDFNDLHQKRGLDAVRKAVEDARKKAAETHLPAGFYLIEKGTRAGLYKQEEKGDDIRDYRLGPPLRVLGRTRDEMSKNWGILLEWKDPAGILHRKALPDEALQKQGTEWAAMLAVDGYSIEPNMHNRFRSFLSGLRTNCFITNTRKVGWYQNCFVLPDSAIGAEDGLVVLQSLDCLGDLYQTNGTLEGWQELARLCAGNSRFTFALCASFAGPLLKLAGLEGGGFSFEGASSCGKTTCLQIAASVWGGPSHLRTWRTTSNGLESVAALHNDGLLILDEVGQASARDLAEVSYMLANGSGKVRAGKSGSARQSTSWRLLFLSSGEQGLADKLGEDGIRSRAGQEVRFVGIPVDKNDIEALHGLTHAGTLVSRIKEVAGQHYGCASRSFLRWLVENFQTAKESLPEAVAGIVGTICPENAGEQVRRVAQRFALVRIAGTLAKEAGVLPAELDEVSAVERCFDAWLENRGSLGSSEDMAILSTVRLFIEQHGASRFQDMDNADATCINRVGFRQKGTDGATRYFIMPEAFKKEVVRGHSSGRAVQVLRSSGWLITKEKDRSTTKYTLPGLGRVSCYTVVMPEDD